MTNSPLHLLGKFVASSVLATFALGLSQAQAAGVNLSYFDNDSSQLATSDFAVWIYDTTPDALPTNLFGSVSVDFDFSLGSNGSSVGIYVGGTARDTATSALALFNLNSSSGDDMIRFSASANCVMATGSSGGAGNLVGDVLSTSNYIAGGSYHANLTVTYLTATTMQATFTISDPHLELTSLTATLGEFIVVGPGEIGLRSYATNGAQNTIDNISITAIPEPSTYAALGGIAVLGLALLQRRRRYGSDVRFRV